MKALKDALQKRRMSAAPVPSEQSPMAAPQLKGPTAPTAESVLGMLPPEEKAKLFDLLRAEVANPESAPEVAQIDDSNPAQMKDSAGELKSTPGEMQALQSEDMNMDVANKLHDPKYSGDEEQQPRNLSERVKMNIAKALKRKG